MPDLFEPFGRIVVKIGSSLLVDPNHGLRDRWLDSLLLDVASLRRDGNEILIVSSGAIALGRRQLMDQGIGLRDGFLQLEENQAAAAVGQIALSQLFAQKLGSHSITAAQILLTIDDTEQRRRYLNARNTIATALKWKTVPVVNENDSVATSEIRYGDNDRLAARVATMCSADLLILFSDVDGLYDSPPHQNPNAKLIKSVEKIDASIEAMAGGAASIHSRGGMTTKIEAAKIATSGGTAMVIASGKPEHPLRRLAETGLGTWFEANSNSVNARKKWIAGGLNIGGKIVIDSGAVSAIRQGKSLLPAGATSVEGSFDRGDTIELVDERGVAIAKGLVEYDSRDAALIVGFASAQVSELLGPAARSTLVHRDNLVMSL